MDIQPISLSASEWDKIPIDVNQGVNLLVTMRKVLEKMWPGFEVGFFTDDDLEVARGENKWAVLTPAHWAAVAEWNEHVPIRYGITEKNGRLVWKGNTICVRPKTFGNEKRKLVMLKSEDTYKAARTGKASEIRGQAADGITVGGSLVEKTSQAPPESYTEGDHDESKNDIYGELPEIEEGKKRGRGRPKE